MNKCGPTQARGSVLTANQNGLYVRSESSVFHRTRGRSALTDVWSSVRATASPRRVWRMEKEGGDPLIVCLKVDQRAACCTVGSKPSIPVWARKQAICPVKDAAAKSPNSLKMTIKMKMRLVGWGAFPGWSSSLQEAAGHTAINSV